MGKNMSLSGSPAKQSSVQAAVGACTAQSCEYAKLARQLLPLAQELVASAHNLVIRPAAAHARYECQKQCEHRRRHHVTTAATERCVAALTGADGCSSMANLPTRFQFSEALRITRDRLEDLSLRWKER